MIGKVIRATNKPMPTMDAHNLRSKFAAIASAAAVTIGGMPASSVNVWSINVFVLRLLAKMYIMIGAATSFIISPEQNAVLWCRSILRVKFKPIINMVTGVNNNVMGLRTDTIIG